METISNIGEVLIYNPQEPLMFTSGNFLFLFLLFVLGYSFLKRVTLPRVIYVTLFSLYFYYRTSGIFFLLLVYTATSDFLIAQAMSKVKSRSKQKWLVGLSLLSNLGLLCYFKYTNFFVGLWGDMTGNPLSFENIFLPIGISFFTFQSLSYTIDVYRGRIRPLSRWVDYLFYVSFFPQLVAGPIVRARDFIPQIRRNPIEISRSDYGRAVFLIALGLIKKAVLSDYIATHFIDQVFEAPTLYSSFENLAAMYGYGLQIYLDFSGYSDMAIGIALLLGFHFPKNFDSPYKSATITEFWRRWHISLSSWLKDYLYISLGGNRKGKLRTYLNLLLTMTLGGLWHGASLRFVLWGVMHGVALALHKVCMEFNKKAFPAQGRDMKSRWRRVFGIFITFNFVTLCWVFFRAESAQSAVDMLGQVVDPVSHNEYYSIGEVLVAYKYVFVLMLVGYTAHFTSERMQLSIQKSFERVPSFIYPVVLALIIWFVIQLRDGQVQSFIYFQF